MITSSLISSCDLPRPVVGLLKQWSAIDKVSEAICSVLLFSEVVCD